MLFEKMTILHNLGRLTTGEWKKLEMKLYGELVGTEFPLSFKSG